jgi:hypothetical protein
MTESDFPTSDVSWLLARCALGELTADQQARLEDQLLHDEQLCLQLAETVALVETLRQTPLASQPTRRVSPALISVRSFAAVAAVLALLVLPAALSTVQPDVLHDAVTFSSMLQTEPAESRNSETDLWAAADLPEPPDWLLTALDLDEQSGDSDSSPAAPVIDDEEEALF